MAERNYTHVGMIGVNWRDSLDVDPILNRNRKWHACVKVPGTDASYKTLCGKKLHDDGADVSNWSDHIIRGEARTITCKKCKTVVTCIA